MRLGRGFFVSTCLLLAAACSSPAPAPPPAPAAPVMSQVERGQYLVTVAVCNDCHTPWKVGPNGQPEPDMDRMLSGHPENLKVPATKVPAGFMAMGNQTFTAWVGAWGTSFTANLTPDQNTGIGVWTEDMFIKALREGKHMGTGRPILPPMPWPFISKMTDDDLKAVFAYLKSIKPISNHVPDPIPPAPNAPAK